MKELGYNHSEIEIACPLSNEGGYYMIANKNTSHRIIAKIQEALEGILATGARDQIIRKYLD